MLRRAFLLGTAATVTVATTGCRHRRNVTAAAAAVVPETEFTYMIGTTTIVMDETSIVLTAADGYSLALAW
jgi:hypothetical protein